MSTTKPERTVLFGYSMGGYIALWLAKEAGKLAVFREHHVRSSMSMSLVWRLTFSMSRRL